MLTLSVFLVVFLVTLVLLARILGRSVRKVKGKAPKSAGRVTFFTTGAQKFARVAGSLYLVQHNGWKKIEDRDEYKEVA